MVAQARAGNAALLDCNAPQTNSSILELLSLKGSPFLWKVMMTARPLVCF